MSTALASAPCQAQPRPTRAGRAILQPPRKYFRRVRGQRRPRLQPQLPLGRARRQHDRQERLQQRQRRLRRHAVPRRAPPEENNRDHGSSWGILGLGGTGGQNDAGGGGGGYYGGTPPLSLSLSLLPSLLPSLSLLSLLTLLYYPSFSPPSLFSSLLPPPPPPMLQGAPALGAAQPTGRSGLKRSRRQAALARAGGVFLDACQL